MKDQLLRAHDLGNSEAENRFAFSIRQRYSRMYYQFKPDKVGWIVVILWRKFMIVLIGGLLRRNPSFQLAIMMLVLFICYIIQVKNRPYMSTVERLMVIEEHKARAIDGDKKALIIQKHIQKATDDRANKKRRSGGINTSSLGDAVKHANRDGRNEGPASYFFNYNTMESVLLACAILVCICGVMFVSDELYLPGNEIAQIIATMFLTIIVMGSMLYIGVVFASELRIKLPKICVRIFADAKTALEKQQEARGEWDDDDDIELNANPLMRSLEDKARIDAGKYFKRRSEHRVYGSTVVIVIVIFMT